MEKIKVENLTFTYNDSSSPVINNLSFSVDNGDFMAVVGASGTGKSTLLSLLKPELSPKGRLTGSVFYEGRPLSDLPLRETVEHIGFVFQNPDKQLVTDKVWHELAFGMESLGHSADSIRVRTAEVASYLGITDLFERETHTLSGGQKQLVNLASVLCMNPSVILLDEPTAQLDPIAAEEFVEILSRLHRDTGITIILVEHRLESVACHCNKLLILSRDSAPVFGELKECISKLSNDTAALSAFPASVRLYKALNCAAPGTDIPITIADGRRFILKKTGRSAGFTDTFTKSNDNALREGAGSSHLNSDRHNSPAKAAAIDISELTFSYERFSHPVLNDLNLKVNEGEILTILGGNGQGKSTLLHLIAGLLSPDSGSVKVYGKNVKKYTDTTLYDLLGLLPQQVETMFLKDSVREELKDIATPAFPMDNLSDIHPYDLSGGEKALLGLNLVLSRDIKILLLDEPTKGLDTDNKRIVADAISALRDKGVTVLLITHDVELAAMISDRIALLFAGDIASINEPHAFFKENFFYTTHFARMTRGIYDDVITLRECIDAVTNDLI